MAGAVIALCLVLLSKKELLALVNKALAALFLIANNVQGDSRPSRQGRRRYSDSRTLTWYSRPPMEYVTHSTLGVSGAGS